MLASFMRANMLRTGPKTGMAHISKFHLRPGPLHYYLFHPQLPSEHFRLPPLSKKNSLKWEKDTQQKKRPEEKAK